MEFSKFIAETETEESLMLMGKINALEGIARWNPELICADMIAAFFGFDIEESQELKEEKKAKKQYLELYLAQLDRNDELYKTNNELLKELKELKAKKEDK